MPTLTTELIALRKKKKLLDERKAVVKKLDQQYKEAQGRIFDRMELEGVQSVKADGTHFVRTETAYATVQDRDAFIEWAAANDDSMLVTKEAEALLNAKVRQCLDDDEPLPPGVGFYVREVIAQRVS